MKGLIQTWPSRDRLVHWRFRAARSSLGDLITYSVRSLEPYRGFHSFMRALPHLQALLPEAHVAIVGKEPTSYLGVVPLRAGPGSR